MYTCFVCLVFLLGVDKAYPHDVIQVALEVCRSPPFFPARCWFFVPQVEGGKNADVSWVPFYSILLALFFLLQGFSNWQWFFVYVFVNPVPPKTYLHRRPGENGENIHESPNIRIQKMPRFISQSRWRTPVPNKSWRGQPFNRCPLVN